ncbi:proteasome subunit alpha type-2-like [Rhodnius prolixus]|uniref:proteasome subunit alpha type-2-like n=1 Tax=Rhodnius prolixus TaxID=13249 RepID=UPI003D18E749
MTVELEDAVHLANLTIKEGFEDQMTADDIEVGVKDQMVADIIEVVCSEAGFRVLDPITKRLPSKHSLREL